MTLQPRSRNLRPMQSDYNTASLAERLADGVVQSVNVVLAVTGCVALGVLVGTHADPLRLAALAVYGAGLLAMVGASALYAWGRGRPHHALYRHLDHAAIFLMIAGTYTPFTLISFDGIHGRRLLALIRAIALVGVLLKLIAPHRVERLAIPLYLIMGWATGCCWGYRRRLPCCSPPAASSTASALYSMWRGRVTRRRSGTASSSSPRFATTPPSCA
jgi:predicted membrane channel-forming protein YqfA (hemolysin III family)